MKKYLFLIFSAVFLIYPLNHLINTGKLIGTVCCQPSVLYEIIIKYGPIISLVLGLVFLVLFVTLYIKEFPKKIFALFLYLIGFLAGVILIALVISRVLSIGPRDFPSGDFSRCQTVGVTLTESEDQGKSKEEIANEIAKLWFDANASEDICPRVRLEDYKINLIDGVTMANDFGVIDENGKNIKFFISYSVKPTSFSRAEWTAGNGETAASSWINDKNGFVMAFRGATGYTMTGISTGP